MGFDFILDGKIVVIITTVTVLFNLGVQGWKYINNKLNAKQDEVINDIVVRLLRLELLHWIDRSRKEHVESSIIYKLYDDYKIRGGNGYMDIHIEEYTESLKKLHKRKK